MESLSKYVMLIGMADKDAKVQTIPTEQFKDTINKVCGDCTIFENITGYYSHEDGTKVKEDTLKVELLFKNDAEVRLMASKLKTELNQESIVLEKFVTNSMLV
jgi:hypothetical protein